jgi:hypothetical protein
MKLHWFVKLVAGLIGFGAAALSSWGAYEGQMKVEGEVNYMVIAAPFVIMAAACLPPIAERLFHIGNFWKSVWVWGVIIPVAVIAFFSSYERVHMAKDTLAAAQRANVKAVQRLEKELELARADTKAKELEVAPTLAKKSCKEVCQTKYKGFVTEKKNAEAAILEKIESKEAKQTVTADMAAPLWLLPATLDLGTFVGIWICFAPNPVPVVEQKPAKRRRKRKSKKGGPRPPAFKKMAANTNDNIVTFPSRA